MWVLHLNKIVYELVGTVECPFLDRWIVGSLDRLAVAWIPWPEVVLIKSWLDKNTDVHKPDFGRRGWTASNARDKERIAEKRVAARRDAAGRVAAGRVAAGRVTAGRVTARRR